MLKHAAARHYRRGHARADHCHAQKAGLFLLTEEDASGHGRLLVNDRNWKTTKQSVTAGEVVDCNTKILLSAEKIDG